MRTVLVALLCLAAAWLAGLVWFVRDLDQPPAPPELATDAIVVLTGGSQRIDRGLALLGAGKAKKLFISGVPQGVDREALLRVNRAEAPWAQCCIVLGHHAEDTVGNARETVAWLRQEGYRSLRLVTANYHMRRALLEFRRVLPGEIVIVADPVVPEAGRPGGWWRGRAAAHLIVVEYVKYLGALVRPVLAPAREAPP